MGARCRGPPGWRPGPLRWKLLYECGGAIFLFVYDVSADPGEFHRLAENPELAAGRAELLEELLRWAIETEDDLPVTCQQPKRPAGFRVF